MSERSPEPGMMGRRLIEYPLYRVAWSGLHVFDRNGVVRGILRRGAPVRITLVEDRSGRRLGWADEPGGLIGWFDGEGLLPVKEDVNEKKSETEHGNENDENDNGRM